MSLIVCVVDLVKAKSFQVYQNKAKKINGLSQKLLPLIPTHLRSDVLFSLRENVLVVHLSNALMLLQMRSLENVLIKASLSLNVTKIDYLIRQGEVFSNPLLDHQDKLDSCRRQSLNKISLTSLFSLEKRLKNRSLLKALKSMLSRYR